MDASCPLLAGDDGEHETRLVHSLDCFSRCVLARPATSVQLMAERTPRSDFGPDATPYFATTDDKHRKRDKRLVSCGSCSHVPCWNVIFPPRILAYEDFATSAQLGDVYLLRQSAREEFDPTLPEDSDMLHHLWSGLFPTLPYEGRVNKRWRDVGFQVRTHFVFCSVQHEKLVVIFCLSLCPKNDDPVSDLRTSGRLAVRMLLFFSDHVHDEFKVHNVVFFFTSVEHARRRLLS
ncbi:hypothetical protein PsorP6_007361 [Peronosclerospora sorghi]|uniref:Uncharacterized protein n=1 Tax=Peronosclerospora sorghi TaxID=230839 RepID=A0ACC0W9P4_9STRA|nr:hypothetical protein PsorP6_007361 [Peronosclerospora sorghi]